MKCPFCGAELKRCSLLSSGLKNPVFMCENKHCEYDHIVISSQIWQALIDGKKAQALLKEIKEDYDFQEIKAREGQDIDWRVLANIFAEEITS